MRRDQIKRGFPLSRPDNSTDRSNPTGCKLSVELTDLPQQIDLDRHAQVRFSALNAAALPVGGNGSPQASSYRPHAHGEKTPPPPPIPDKGGLSVHQPRWERPCPDTPRHRHHWSTPRHLSWRPR